MRATCPGPLAALDSSLLASDTLVVVSAVHLQLPCLLGVVSRRFEISTLVLGVLLVLGAWLSGLARRSFISLTAVFVIAGFLLGDGVTGWLQFDPRSTFVSELATVALIVILFRDGLEVGIPAHQRSLYALGTAFATCGLAVLTPDGNGLIAVYVGAIVLGIRRPDIRRYFERQAADLVEIVKLGIFVVFGSLLTLSGLFGSGWAAVGVVVLTLLVARPVSVFVALAGTATDTATRGFMAWFGPKGVATMTFSLLVLSEQIRSGQGRRSSTWRR